MPDIVGIRFKRAGKIYSFDPDGLSLRLNDLVIVESDFGLTLGRVVKDIVFTEKKDRPLKKVLRLANEEDLNAVKENKKLEREAFEYCIERVNARGIQMKLVCTESTIDKKRIIFFFTADGRIDFRELVKDLAARFRTRIEMRQIGVRDESKMIGGIGICGREFCCSTFLQGFEPVAIKMAKDQELVLNVSKLSGVCGRLMCCLRYEFDGDVKEIAIEDEPVPPEVEDTVLKEADSTMASIISSINDDETEVIPPVSLPNGEAKGLQGQKKSSEEVKTDSTEPKKAEEGIQRHKEAQREKGKDLPHTDRKDFRKRRRPRR